MGSLCSSQEERLSVVGRHLFIPWQGENLVNRLACMLFRLGPWILDQDLDKHLPASAGKRFQTPLCTQHPWENDEIKQAPWERIGSFWRKPPPLRHHHWNLDGQITGELGKNSVVGNVKHEPRLFTQLGRIDEVRIFVLPLDRRYFLGKLCVGVPFELHQP